MWLDRSGTNDTVVISFLCKFCVQPELTLPAVSSQCEGNSGVRKLCKKSLPLLLKVGMVYLGCTVCDFSSPSRWITALLRGFSSSYVCFVRWCSSSQWIRHSVSKSIKVYQKFKMLYYVLAWDKWKIYAIGMTIHWKYICNWHSVFCEQPFGNPLLYATDCFIWSHLLLFL